MWGKICKQLLTAGVAGDGKIYIAGISKLLDQLPGMGKYLGHVIDQCYVHYLSPLTFMLKYNMNPGE